MGAKFVVLDKDGLLMYGPSDEAPARDAVLRLDREYPEDAPHTIHPIGPALPAKVADITREADAAFAAMYPASDPISASPVAWKTARDVASAVIAAHEASVRHNVVTRWAVRETTLNRWAQKGRETTVEKSGRTLFSSRDEAKDEQRSFDNWEKRTRIVKVTTRRRRVKP